MSGITKLIDHITLPRFVKAHQIFEHNELTEEEKALEASGDIVVSYGTDEVKKEFIESVSWSDNGLNYSLITQNGSLGSDGLCEMAKEIIDK